MKHGVQAQATVSVPGVTGTPPVALMRQCSRLAGHEDVSPTQLRH